jgi:hypothetical protein
VTGRWAIPVDGWQSILDNERTVLAYRCPCGCMYWEGRQMELTREDAAMKVGICRVCRRPVTLGEVTVLPQAGDGKVVQIPGWGLACTAHHGVPEFFATIRLVDVKQL